jgi:general secretion pathway protein G
MDTMKRRLQQSGVTLVEMLVVVSILAILAIMFGFGMPRLQRQSQVRSVERMFHLMDEALIVYQQERGAFPEAATIEDLYREMASLPAAREIMGHIEVNWGRPASPVTGTATEDRSAWPPVLDPWGEMFRYQWQAQGGDTFPHLISNGPDGLPNTDDDIMNR